MDYRMKNRKTNHYIKKHGFTIVEILIVAPIVILVIGVFIGVVVNMTGDVLSTRSTNALAYNIQDALNRIEQDVSTSGALLATNNVTITSPQGFDDSTATFDNASVVNGTMLILNSYATTANPLNATSNVIYESGQPNPCNSALINKNPAVMMNTVYFVKNNTLWRRVLAPSNYATIGCSVPWQEPSCTPNIVGAFCKTQDIDLVDGINTTSGFVVNYYPNPSSVIPNTIANDSAQSDSNRLAAMRTNGSVVVTINATSSQAGRNIGQTGTMRATSPNNNTSTTSNPIAPTILSQPQDKTVLASDTNITFSASPSGTSPTAQWQQSTDQGATWSNVSGATSSTLTLATVNNTMDGYKYRVIFTNAQGTITSTSARLGVNLLAWTALTLQNSWANYNNGYNTAAYRKTSDGVVTVKGLIGRTGTPVVSEVIGILPVSYRPTAVLIFVASTNPNVAGRVDVYPNGEIRFIGGDAAWFSLDNIRFVPDTGRYPRTAIGSFFNGWLNYGAPFAPASYVIDNSNRVNIQGLLAPGVWPDSSRIFDLPSNALPANYMHVIGASSTFGAFGVDYRAGSTGLLSKSIGSGWLSTNVMYYPTTTGNWFNIPLINSWGAYGSIFTPPQYSISSDGLVSLRGLISAGSMTSDGVIGTLPVGYRPGQRVLYATVSMLAYSRVDVDAAGNIRFGTGNNGWLSLDGITFYADQ